MFGQNGCIWAKLIVFYQSGWIYAKCLYLGKWLYFCKIGCTCMGKKWLYFGELVVFGLNGVFGQNGCILGKIVVFGQNFCMREKWLY